MVLSGFFLIKYMFIKIIKTSCYSSIELEVGFDSKSEIITFTHSILVAEVRSVLSSLLQEIKLTIVQRNNNIFS